MRRTTASCTSRAPTATPATPTTASASSSSRTRCSTRSGCGRPTRWRRSPSALGEDAGPYREAAAGIGAALRSRLWDGERFRARDLRSGALLEPRTIGSLAPLLDPALPATVAQRLAADLESPHFWAPGGIGVASFDLLDPAFDRRRYWRGPVWANLNWLLARGLRGHGLAEPARRLEEGTVRLVATAGLREYFDPLSGEGLGSDDFSWTAAAVLDILHSKEQPQVG